MFSGKTIWPFKIVSRIINTGTSHLRSEEERKTITTVNIFSLASIILCLLFGAGIFFLTDNIRILLPAYIEAALFVIILGLNRFGLHNAAAIGMTIIHNASVVYFSALMGMLTEVHLLFLFLLGAALTVFRERKPLIIGSICVAIVSIVLCELNYYYRFVEPIVNTEHEQFRIRWVAIPAILLLNMLTIAVYVRALRKSNNYFQRKAADLEKADKIKARRVMETSHEIRNPFNAVYGIAQELLMKVQNGEEYKDLKSSVEHLHSASYNVLQILNNNLELYRIQDGIPTTPVHDVFNLRDWALEVTGIYQYIANVRNVKIELRIEEDLPRVIEADKTKLTQIVNNLLFNAIKFTVQNSTVQVKMSRAYEGWEIQVKDSGHGIAPERLLDIFTPFVSEYNELGGTGLGLPIVKNYVELLGGVIDVYSPAGEGATFSVKLPLVSADVTCVPRDETRTIRLRSFKGVRALVIDDNEMSNLVLVRFLKHMECEVSTAFNGEEGLEKIMEEKPDLVFLDGHMPKMNGLELLARLRQLVLSEEVRVIAVSGDAMPESIHEMLHAGAHGYITKPIDLKALGNTMSQVLEDLVM
ncbi:MAG TPA: ATP-binding protein [Chitinophaga sp.]|uniref:ATP-binding response regulator n=1 Tax=Chitinophaga sp. TaxID=1869181 RepID=UPI002C280A79|nr:ATP-binding protein [Chitinophaga sp.]HVI44640.1 ATP-binding protein [Chitinophaga sp.]